MTVAAGRTKQQPTPCDGDGRRWHTMMAMVDDDDDDDEETARI
jgi:hypothetical protein